jgi:hypothetical protein
VKREIRKDGEVKVINNLMSHKGGKKWRPSPPIFNHNQRPPPKEAAAQ